MTTAMAVPVHTVLGGLEPIACTSCGKTIALWDASRQVIVYVRRRENVYAEVPGRRMLIQCHREKWQEGRMVVCGHINQVHIPEEPLDKP